MSMPEPTQLNPSAASLRTPDPALAACITGMHRSGTSMVAGLLHACGLALGPEDELTRPAPDNAEGFFEDPRFVRLNDGLLAHLGGRWDDPPSLPVGWEFDPGVDPLIELARNLVAQPGRRPWGWKDPRTSLTLPLWRRLIPDLKVVICLRNPLEVAHSLFARGDSKSLPRFRLWLIYYRQLLSATRPERRLVTHYRSYFEDPRAELRRVTDWLGLKVSDAAVERACARVSAALRHHFAGAGDLIGVGAPDEVLGLYFGLCAEAGPVYRRARERESAGEIDDAAARAGEVNALLLELQQTKDAFALRERALQEELQQAIAVLDLRESALRVELQQTKAALALREQALQDILNSKSFRLVSAYWRLWRK